MSKLRKFLKSKNFTSILKAYKSKLTVELMSASVAFNFTTTSSTDKFSFI